MAVTLLQECSWPGVLAIESLSGTVSHGITPGVFILTSYPQAAVPEAYGALAFGDGTRRVVLRDCKVDTLTGHAGEDGQTFTLVIQDRRWRWRFGAISGRYNQLDTHGKLIPWTIRSPSELAKLCLDAMGETNYVIELPPGLSRAAGQKLEDYLRAGEDFPQSLSNPPVEWDKVPPAEALARLADYYGCRVVWQPISDRVIVVPLGQGQVKLPDGPCELIAPAITNPPRPSAVAVAGAPVRIQFRVPLEAVGQEWDGEMVPINDLSYAPRIPPQKQVVRVDWFGTATDPSIKIYITYRPKWNPPEGEEKTVAFEYGGTGTADDKFALIAKAIKGNPELNKFMGAATVANGIVFVSKVVGFPFQVRAETSAALPNKLTVTVTTPAVYVGWDACPPPTFAAVQATERLSYDQALQLARKSVFKCYRIRNVDIVTGKTPINVPFFGPLVRRQQLIAQSSRVEQVIPEPRQKFALQQNPIDVPKLARKLFGKLPDFYNGYSRDKPAAVYGSISRKIGNVLFDSIAYNTNSDDEVFVPFSVDAVEQMVVFSDYVYVSYPVANTLNQIRTPALVLETSFLLTDAETGEVVRWKEVLPLGGPAPVHWGIHEDIVVDIGQAYQAKHKPLGKPQLLNLEDARPRAAYYLAGMARQFELSGGETRQYLGIKLVDLDGAVQQVSWSLGEAGATTTASSNCEHASAIPAYPARRRAEGLAANTRAAQANLTEAWWMGRGPMPPWIKIK